MYQENFLKRLLSKARSKKNVAKFLQEELGLTKDAAYRRIRGSTAFYMDELYRLSIHFDISLDELKGGDLIKEKLEFDFIPFEIDNLKVIEYFINLYRSFDNLDDVKITFASKQIPNIQIFFYRELLFFHAFFLSKILADNKTYGEVFSIRKFQSNPINIEKWRKGFLPAYKTYLKIISTEIYSPNSFDDFLMEIKYCWDSQLFETKKDALIICNQLESFIHHLKAQAETGFKFLPNDSNNPQGEYHLYYFEASSMEYMAMVENGTHKTIYNMNNSGDYLACDNGIYTNRVETYINNIIKLSAKVSGENEMNRNRMIKVYCGKLNDLRSHILKTDERNIFNN